jgi:glycine/D-amino acid oxidase-like deaminating enzyme
MNARRKFLLLTAIAALIGSQTSAFSIAADRRTCSSAQRRRFETAHLLSSSSAGQGGGVFYDGPEPTHEQQRMFDDPSKSLLSTSSSSKTEAALTTTTPSFQRHPVPQRKDVVVIGGGLAGLSAALYLSQIDPDRHVCVLERESIKPSSSTSSTTTVASLAAAGMLAPQSERLPSGPLLDLCLQSRRLYPDFCSLVETLAQDESVAEYLSSSSTEHSTTTATLPPWSVGYMASGGFLAPAFAGDAVATWSPPSSSSSSSSSSDNSNSNSDSSSGATWLDATQVRELEPQLHPDVVGGWWFPEDASVDARRLSYSLRAACVAAGVEFQENTEVTSLDLVDGRCRGVWCRRHASNKENQSGSNKYLETNAVLVANGAWMRQLLPVPLEPHKGQSLSLRMPANKPPLLRRVLFAQDSYIVPKADGRIVVGATVEGGSYDPNVTPAGILHVLSHALQLVPGLADLPLEETWVGLRPTTPDKGPILGKTPWGNLFLAGGYWRNGVLLAPKTGQMLAALIAGKDDMLSASDQALLDAFAWDRFTSPEGGAKLAANARYAASMHPIHQRASGSGVAAAVGTELGSYSTARSASEERQKDRRALFDTNSDDSLERAAMLGRQDAGAFSYEKDEVGNTRVSKSSEMATNKDRPSESQLSLQPATTTPYEGSADAWTVNHSPAEDDDEEESESLNSIYDKIRENKAKTRVEMGVAKEDERPDPGFRIYHVDSETGESREVPPYTTQEEMEKIVAQEKKDRSGINGEAPNGSSAEADHHTVEAEKGDSVLNGYQAIYDASEGVSPEESAEAMNELRNRARGETESLNLNESEFPTLEQKRSKPQQFESEDPAMNDVYQRIRENKAASTSNVEMTESIPEERPDPGFRIYHVDSETGESREVPPYTTPEEMQRIVARDKAARSAAPNGSSVPPKVNGTPSTRDEPPTLNGGPKCTDPEEYNEQTFDGYTAIQQANARGSRQEELEAMRAAREQNRFLDNVDESQIGARQPNKD